MAAAYILSLVLAALIFVPVIGYIGISPIGELALGRKGTMTYAANATFHNTLASFGSGITIILWIAAAGFCLLGVILLLGKAG